MKPHEALIRDVGLDGDGAAAGRRSGAGGQREPMAAGGWRGCLCPRGGENRLPFALTEINSVFRSTALRGYRSRSLTLLRLNGLIRSGRRAMPLR